MESRAELIRVKVSTGAKKELLRVGRKGTFAIAVKEKPKRGSANKRVVELLRGYFGSGSVVRLVHGQRSSSKIFSIVRKS